MGGFGQTNGLSSRCGGELSSGGGQDGSLEGRNSELGNRLFVEAVIWKFRSGAPWRDLPERQLEEHSHAVLAVGEERRVGEFFKTLADDSDNEYAMIDVTIVRAHQHSAGALKKGGSTKP